MSTTPERRLPNWRIRMELAGIVWFSECYSEETKVRETAERLREQDVGAEIEVVVV